MSSPEEERREADAEEAELDVRYQMDQYMDEMEQTSSAFGRNEAAIFMLICGAFALYVFIKWLGYISDLFGSFF